MGHWEGHFCNDCNRSIDDEVSKGMRHWIAGREVCGYCWKKPRVAPELQRQGVQLNGAFTSH